MKPLQTLLEVPFQRWFKLLAGLILFGIGIALMKQSQLGLSPWEVLHDGISKVSGIAIGTVSILIGIVVLLLWIPMREKPGIGTILNILIVGNVTNLTLIFLPVSNELLIQIIWLVIGLLMIGLASALYLSSRLGAGPRDGLMMSLYRQTSFSIRLIRSVMEVGVLLVGWLLHGTIGIGTLAFALGIGPIIQFMFRLIGDHELASNRNRT